ncbi:MAG: tRNA guanosine(34) transglycosylase Tgt [Patescibacteria group bacterium]
MSIPQTKSFRVVAPSKKSKARLGSLRTAHGPVESPFFMPIATRGAVKTLTPDEIHTTGAQIILSNTYHLWQRPGMKIIKKAGGLHTFMGWPGPILTDSGGYQVFSLARSRKITERGVQFTSDIDGQKYLLTPEKAIDIQHALGSDIMMSLDECPSYPSTRQYAKRSLEMTTRWAERGLKRLHTLKSKKQLLFGIVQGSSFHELRQQSAEQLVGLDFDGYAVGGVAVGEPTEKMYKAIDWVEPLLPRNKPRYLMGVGYPEQIVEAVRRGIDMFDCVLPTRNARHGSLFVFTENQPSITGKSFYNELLIKQSGFSMDMKPVDPHCGCYTCRHFSRAYLRHLFMSGDPLSQRLATIHNVSFYIELMRVIRENIKKGKL